MAMFSRPSRVQWVYFIGAGIGLTQVIATMKYADTTIPIIGDYIPAPWNKYSTLGNIIVGGLLGLVVATGKLKESPSLNGILLMYAITSLAGGAINGLLPTTFPLSASQQNMKLNTILPRYKIIG